MYACMQVGSAAWCFVSHRPLRFSESNGFSGGFGGANAVPHCYEPRVGSYPSTTVQVGLFADCITAQRFPSAADSDTTSTIRHREILLELSLLPLLPAAKAKAPDPIKPPRGTKQFSAPPPEFSTPEPFQLLR